MTSVIPGNINKMFNEELTTRDLRNRGFSSFRVLRLVLVCILAVIITGLAFIHLSHAYSMYVVKSQSMVPAIDMGDVIITGSVGGLFSPEIKPGVIISYKTGKSLVAHRIISFNNNTLVTKGDAVEDPDPQPVSTSGITGVYLFRIPKLGYLSAFLHTKIGWFLLVILPASILLAFTIKEIIKEALSSTPVEPGRR
jgi:signal peptidase I